MTIQEQLKGEFWSSQFVSASVHAALLATMFVAVPAVIHEIKEGTVQIDIVATPTIPPMGNQVRIADVQEKPLKLEAPVQIVEVKPEPEMLAKQQVHAAVAKPKDLPKHKYVVNDLPIPKKDHQAKKSKAPMAVAVAKVEDNPEVKQSEKADPNLLEDTPQIVAPPNAEEKSENAAAADLLNVEKNLEKPEPTPEKPSDKDIAAAAVADSGVQKQKSNQEGDTKVEQASQPNLPYGIPNGVRDADSLRQYPGNVPPEYPVQERLERQEGKVEFYAFVNNEGRIMDLRVKNSSGKPSFDGAAMKAFKNYRFFPGQSGWVEKRFVFSLKGPATNIGGRLRR